MPYKVKIADTESNNKFLKNLPKSILPEFAKHLKRLGNHPYLGRSVDAPIPTYQYSFKTIHKSREYTFVVSYDINEYNEVINITDFGSQTITPS